MIPLNAGIIDWYEEIFIYYTVVFFVMSYVPDSPRTDRQSIHKALKTKALAYGFVALVLGALSVISIILIDPVPFVEEVGLVLGTLLTSRAAIKQARS